MSDYATMSDAELETLKQQLDTQMQAFRAQRQAIAAEQSRRQLALQDQESSGVVSRIDPSTIKEQSKVS